MSVVASERLSNGTRTVEISDTFEAAAYECLGHPVSRITGPATRRRFVFETLPDSVLQAFEADELLVSPTRLKASYKSLLSRLRQEQEPPR